MANYMFVLRPFTKTRKIVCTACAQSIEVLTSCSKCHGNGVTTQHIPQYRVQDRPILIERVDRDPDTGILRYWENSCEFFHETNYPSLNHYVPSVPYGIHLLHDSKESAINECDRINKFLSQS